MAAFMNAWICNYGKRREQLYHERLDMQLWKETRTVIPWTPGYPMTERDENSYTMDAWICNDGKRREHLYCTAVHDNFIKPLQKLHFTADHVISAMD